MSGYNIIICPGTHNQNGRHLMALLAAAGAESVRVFLCDSLARYNLGSYEVATAVGDDWLKRHKEILKKIIVKRWDDILSHPTYISRRKLVQNIYDNVPQVKRVIDDVCNANTNARLIRKSDLDHDTVMKNSIHYMLEEVAGLAVIHEMSPWPEINPGEYFSDPYLFDRHVTGPLRLVIPAVIPLQQTQVA